MTTRTSQINQKTIIEFEDIPGGDTLAAALYHESYQWLESDNPQLLQSIEQAIVQGATPDAIRQQVSKVVGPDRQPIVRRCYLAAMHVHTTQGSSWGVLDGKDIGITPAR